MGNIKLDCECCIQQSDELHQEEKVISNNCNDAETLKTHNSKQTKAQRTVKLQKIPPEVF